MFIKQLSIFMENKAGRMAEISRILADGGVNIRALSVADTTGFGILRLIVDDPEKAERVCRAAGLTTALTDAIAISMDDRPGGFADVMETVAEAKISVEYMYAFVSRKKDSAFLTPADDDRACIIMCTSDGERAVRLLREKGITILSGDEIYTL